MVVNGLTGEGAGPSGLTAGPALTGSEADLPPCTTWGGSDRVKKQTQWVCGIDKLRLLAVGPWPADLLDAVPGNVGGPWRRGRNRGSDRVENRVGWTGERGRAIRWEHRRYDDGLQSELRVEWSPLNWGPAAATIAMWVAGRGIDLADAYVERVDVCFDLRGVDRQRLRLDPGRSKYGTEGLPIRLETEYAGRVKGNKRKAKLYDKRLERMVKGHDDPGQWSRFELEAWGPYSLIDDADDVLHDVRLSELHRIKYPVADGVCVREFAYGLDDYADARYGLLAAGAFALGTRWAEKQAKRVLGSSPKYRDLLRFVCWPELSPGTRFVFERSWADVVDRVRSWCTPEGVLGGAS